MSTISRRKMITRGLAAAAGLSGVAVAGRIADRYGLVPPDHGGIYGPGATLTYAAQRLITRRSLAREFSRSQISNPPFANEIAKPSEHFARLQADGFKDWRLTIEGLIARPASLSLDDIRRFPARRQITEVVCEEGWSYIAEWIGAPLVDVVRAAGIMNVFDSLPTLDRRPTCVIASTNKGRGVSFIEDRVEWHHRVPTDEELSAALLELEGDE